MSRTLHVDLTPSRRSKRLLQNGYYRPPPGEQLLGPESNSEEDDDNASVHSNSSSIYSERQIRYNESPSAVFSHHRRRRRRVLESPRAENLLSSSPNKRTPQKQTAITKTENIISRSTPNLLVAQSESQTVTKTNRTQTREMKTTIHAIKQSSHRYAHGESSSLAHFSRSAQYAASAGTVSASRNETHDAIMTRNQTQFNAIGGGDRISAEDTNNLSRINTNSSQRNSTRLETYGDTDESHTRKSSNNHISQSQYSSAESDMEHTDYTEKRGTGAGGVGGGSGVAVTLMSLIWLATDWISYVFGYICRTIYKVTLSIFVFDVLWLSKRTSPWFARLIRALLLFLLVLFFLTSTYLLATRLFGNQAETLLLPVQSLAGLLQTLSQKFSSFYAFSTSRDGAAYGPIITQTTQETHSRPALEMNDEMFKASLHLADKLAEVKEEVKVLQKQQLDFNKKQMEDFKNALITLERKLQNEISDQISASNGQMAERLQLLKDEIAALRVNHTTTNSGIKNELQQVRGLLADQSKMSAQVNEFNARLTAFDSRLNTLNNMMMKSVAEFDKHVGNTTYVKEIAKMQFIESFLKIIKSGEGSDDRNSLHFLFIAWLKKQGFAQIDEVERNMKTLSVNTNLTMSVLEKKFALHLERIRHNTKRYSNTITLEKIVETPLQKANDAQLSTNEAQVREWIQNELALYSADRIGLADHALESAGGYVVSTRCSESYNRKTALVSLFGIPIYYNINTPRSVIQSSTLPGECWSFKGAEGYVVIALSGFIQPTSFSLEHIPRELSPYGRIDSAPKDFSVLGLVDMYDYKGVLLGKYRYEENGPVIQQFPVISDQQDYFSHIELRVSSNWGHPDYTCLYRFRVHGNRKGADIPYV